MRTTKYAARRFLAMLIVLVLMSALVFFLMRIIPGDPVGALLGFTATPEAMEKLRNDLGLDRPMLEQYAIWVGQVLRGDLGTDYRAHEPITEMLLRRIPVTLELAILAMFFALMISLPLGVLSALRPNSIWDYAATFVGFLGITMPDFWIGMLAIFFVALKLGLLPASGFMPLGQGIGANLAHLILPAFTLSIVSAAVQVRMVRSAVLEVISQNYITVAYSKGLSEPRLILRHILPNAAIIVVTVLGMQSGYLLGGSIVVEELFRIPGIGSLMIDAVFTRNYPVVQATTLLVALMFMLVNFITDVSYAFLNPQVK